MMQGGVPIDRSRDRGHLQPDDFMTLFLAQLKNQNPMSPADSSQILQQMSEISSIKSSVDMQKTMKELEHRIEISMGTSQLLQAGSMIGKSVDILSEQQIAPLDEKDGMRGAVAVPGAASGIQLTIKNDEGKIMRTIDLGPTTGAGMVDFSWDGLMGEDGEKAPPGFYHIEATATMGTDAKSVPVAGAFRVNSVAMNPATGGIILNVDGLGGTPIEQVVKIL
jgi:flagellar basal-body rod modification protein FlgD